jgi:arginyl-tRNA synthetase
LEFVDKVEVAGPGFINFRIKDKGLAHSLKEQEVTNASYAGKKIVVEYAHPNTHKAFHIGHLRNITTGESIIRLLEAAGANVIRVNYQGDVGMHIAKCIYGILNNSEFSIESVGGGVEERVEFLGKAYVAGSKAFEEDENAKKEIGEINKKIYSKDTSIFDLYQKTRQWSLDYFEKIYKRVDSHFDRYYFESEVYESGKENVLNGLEKGIFEKSEGAIIFPGKKHGLHDRVFVTSEGNPTYEGKEMGLGLLQFSEHHPDRIIHVVGPEQAGYFQVVFEALAQLFPETRDKEQHLVYGWVKLKEGKMSSRTGQVILGEWLLNEAKNKILESYASSEEIAEQISVGAVKYSFLKVGLGQEIAFDLNESIALEGNSGPYIQYSYARTQSVLAKAGDTSPDADISSLQAEERDLLKLLSRFPEIVGEAAERLSPNLLCTYLFELSQAFNLFYQKCPILKSEEKTQRFRLFLTQSTGSILQKGLSLLGISAPNKM